MSLEKEFPEILDEQPHKRLASKHDTVIFLKTSKQIYQQQPNEGST